ncbi:MAG: phosphate acyltransferase [Caldisericaceae bacterium]
MIKNFNEIFEQLKGFGRTPVIVAGGEDLDALEAVYDGYKAGIAEGVLIGNKEKIEAALHKFDDKSFVSGIISAPSEEEKARIAVDTVRNGGILLKGTTKTSTLMKAVLNKEWGLRGSGIMSSVAAFESDFEGKDKIVLISDGGIVMYPDVPTLIAMIDNAVFISHKLGIETPRVALLCAVETVNPDMPETLNASVIAKMNARGQIKGCIVDGPLALDNALSTYAAEKKGIKSEVAGNADILILPNIVAGNVLGKAVEYIAHKPLAVTVVGAKAPVMISSRADRSESKLRSIALTILASR